MESDDFTQYAIRIFDHGEGVGVVNSKIESGVGVSVGVRGVRVGFGVLDGIPVDVGVIVGGKSGVGVSKISGG